MPVYEPEPVPFGDGSNQELRDYLWREYLRISGTLGKYPFIQIEEQSAQPEKVQNGTILWADGALFNPGAGAGFYGRRGDAWFKLDNDGGPATFTTLRLTDTTDVTLASTGHAFQIGPSSGVNLAADGDEIQARNNGAASGLNLNIGGGNVTLGDTASILTLNGGKIAFPATQQASADPNTLDDYEEGTWTPVLTFATPGDLSVVYSLQTGTYRKVGSIVTARFQIVTTTFTHTTAAGALRITGLPFTAVGSNYVGPLDHQGLTAPAAGHTQIITRLLTPNIEFVSCGYGVTRVGLTTPHAPTAVQKVLVGWVEYYV